MTKIQAASVVKTYNNFLSDGKEKLAERWLKSYPDLVNYDASGNFIGEGEPSGPVNDLYNTWPDDDKWRPIKVALVEVFYKENKHSQRFCDTAEDLIWCLTECIKIADHSETGLFEGDGWAVKVIFNTKSKEYCAVDEQVRKLLDELIEKFKTSSTIH